MEVRAVAIIARSRSEDVAPHMTGDLHHFVRVIKERLARHEPALTAVLPLELAGDDVAPGDDLVVGDCAGHAIDDRRERSSQIAQDVAPHVLIDVSGRRRVVHVDEPVGVALLVPDDLRRDAEAPRFRIVENVAEMGPAEDPAHEDIDQRADPRQQHRDEGLDDVQQLDQGLQDVGADQPGDPLEYRLQDVRPTADDVGDRVAYVVADVLAPAVAAENPAEEVADAADDTADGAAHRVDDGVADVLEYLDDRVDQLLNEPADLHQHVLDKRDEHVDDRDDRLGDQLADEAHRTTPSNCWEKRA